MSFGEPPREDRGGLGPPPIPFRIGREPLPNLHAARWLVVAVAIFVLFITASVLKGIYADYLWFDSLGYGSVFSTQLVTKVALFFIAGLLFLALIGVNLWLARRLSPVGLEESFIPDVEPATLRRILTIGSVAGALFLAVIFGSVAAGQWDTWLRLTNGVSFGIKDPAFSRDAGFYVFSLPALQAIQGWLIGAVIVTLIAVIGVYAFAFSLQNFELHLPRGIRAHLGALLIALLVLFDIGYLLSIYQLTTSNNGYVEGATYTDLHARLPGYIIAGFFSLAAIAGVGLSIVRRSFTPAIAGAAAWLVALIVVLGLYPQALQKITVEPNEQAKEAPYIQRNIAMTRAAFGLDKVDEQGFDASTDVAADLVTQNQATIENIRLWDPRFETQTYRQQQEIQQLYQFADESVDVDRYQLNSKYTEVTLDARELSPANLPARGWINVHLQYTHGYGAVVNPVNQVDQFGLPAYTLQNIPPVGVPKLDQPRIYYGQLTNDYAIVGAKQSEFDFTNGKDISETTRYTGKGGIGLSSLFRKLIFAWDLGDTNILISGQITGDSRLLLRRNIRDRVSHIAPFLSLDRDPYLVIADGQQYWVQDAYTTTSNFPYSQQGTHSYNYVRNSVKVVINAYDGQADFYLSDTGDPIVRTYQHIFPKLFKPMSEMPASLQSHLRYPEDLFTAQADVYRTYHMTDPSAFYTKSDLWATPKEGAGGNSAEVVPYYLIMRLPGETSEEFVLIRPFTPNGKSNAVSLMAARIDGPNYGKLVVYKFPSGRTILGPAQVESSIDGETEISQRFSLLNVQGSRVVRGNLLLIPVGQSLLYVEPVYLQAEQNPKPAVIAVIAYANDHVFMEPSLSQALAAVTGQAPPTYTVSNGAVASTAAGAAAQPRGSPTPGASAVPSASAIAPPPPTGLTPTATDVAGLVHEAADASAQAQADLRAGDFAGYGQQQARLQAALDRLNQLVGTAMPTPTAR